MPEVPSARYGRKNTTQQVQFFRADIFGGDPLLAEVGRVGLDDVLLRGTVYVDQAFSAGTLTLTAGTTSLGTVDLTATGSTAITIPAALVWNRTKIGANEYDIIATRDVAGTPDIGAVTVIIENVHRRISNQPQHATVIQ